MDTSSTSTQPVDTPLFKRILILASEIALSRFKLLNLIRKAYQKLSDPQEGQKLRTEVLDRLLLFIRMAKAIVTREYKGLPWRSFVRLIAGLLYFVMIADLIPDFIPFMGFADDALVVAWVYNALEDDLRQFEEWETTYAVEWADD